MAQDIKRIQMALLKEGYSPGPIDGIWGRGTIGALKLFQAARGLPATGVADAATISALIYRDATVRPAALAMAVPPWLAQARRVTGLTESGKGRNALIAWLRSDGKTLGDPARLPWCGDFVQTAIALTLPDERLPANPYYALNWSAFGRPTSAAVGAVLVFQRPGGGHVGFCEGQSGDYYLVRGGNQSDSVSVAKVAKARCVAVRWPTTYPLPATPNWIMGQDVHGATITTNEA